MSSINTNTNPPSAKTNKQKFIEVYSECLYDCVRDNPELYGYSIDQVPSVVKKMADAINRLSFNHDGLAFKMACKRLNVEYKRQSILNYLKG
jgi:hypothetical protein